MQSKFESNAGQIGHLLTRALTHFESNREVAWSCLRRASILLAQDYDTPRDHMPPLQPFSRPSGLATWQANRAIVYMEDNLGSKLTTRDIANHLAFSRGHFSRAFARCLGCSPTTYLMMRRIERAKLMMTSTTESLATIAVSCGFADQSHLCRRFRHAVGMNPSLWRRMSRRPAV
jgi:AraC family transcriptional regulator